MYAINDIWGDPTGSYDLFSSPPTGTPSKGINAIWDKLDDHESRIQQLEQDVKDLKDDVSSLQSDVSSLQSDVNGLKNPINGGTGSGGSGSSGGGSSGGTSVPGGAGLGYDIDGYDKYYCYLMGGFILQWGRLSNWKIHGSNNGTMTYVTFPIPFPHKCMSLVVSVEGWDMGAGADDWSKFTNLTNVGAYMGMDHNGSAWIAIGN